MKHYSKVKQVQKLGFRTPDHFKGQTFAVPKSTRATAPRFNPAQFKTQHKG